MKIVYVITRSDILGGASIHLLDLAKGAQDAGHDVEIIVGGFGKTFFERAAVAGIKCTGLASLVREISLFNDTKAFFQLRKMIKQRKPDLVHLHSSKAGLIGRLVAFSLSIPAVFTAHGWAFTEGVSETRRKLYCFLEKQLARITNVIITVSEYDRQLALASKVSLPNNMYTIYNGVFDTNNISTKNGCSDIVKLIMVARFEAPKNHLDLINALVPLKHLNWQLECVGEGQLQEQAKQLSEQYQLQEKIIFSGFCSDITARLQYSDIFLLVSDWEGLPLTILEAMSSGLPVICSDVGGVPETIINGKTGYLVPKSDISALTEVIQRLLLSPETRYEMGIKGRKLYEEKFTYNVMLEKTLALYHKVLS